MSEEGKLIEFVDLTTPVDTDEWLLTKIGPHKVIMIGMLEYSRGDSKSYIPIWTRSIIEKPPK